MIKRECRDVYKRQAFGELANLLLGSLIVCSILAEIIRKGAGYKNYKGIVMSYILLSLSNIGSPLYVWVFSDYRSI